MRKKHSSNLMTVNRRVTTACTALALSIFAGCGGIELPELAPVEGKVTLDDQPLAGVRVSFYPSSGGKPGTGATDEEGHYELVYTAGEAGTKPGQNRVEVTTIWAAGEQMDEEDKVPPQYQGRDSTLSFDVKAGEDNVFDISMQW